MSALTIHEVLQAVESRSRKYGQPFVTRVETARELGVSRIEVDPVFDEAVEKGDLEEDPKNKGYWRLTPAGQARLDELLFNTEIPPEQAPDVVDASTSTPTLGDEEAEPDPDPAA